MIRFRRSTASVRGADNSRTRREDRTLDPGEMRRSHQPGGSFDIDCVDRHPIARGKRIQRRAMHQIPTTLESARKLAGALEIAEDRFTLAEPRFRIAHKRAHSVTRREQLTKDVAADETGCPGQKNAISGQRLRESTL
jgi:hypothetical protein